MYRPRNRLPTPIDIAMQSFRAWLDHRLEDEAPEAARLAMLIASAGAAGVPVDRLRRLLNLSLETLADLLRALTATGQAEVDGELRYRARG